MLITRNAKDFQTDRLTDAGVKVMTADAYLTGLLRRRPRAAQESCIGLAATKSRPVTTPCELAKRLHGAGAPMFAGRLADRLGCT